MQLRQRSIVVRVFGGTRTTGSNVSQIRSTMVGIECKACGHRVLLMHETGKMDHEVMAMVSPAATRGRCNASKPGLISLQSSLAGACLIEG